MTMRGSWIWLVEIEGLARAGLTSGPRQFLICPMALTSDPWPGNAAFADGAGGRVCDEWQDVLQPGSVTLSGMSFAPFSAQPAAQTLSFDVALPDALPEIAAYFLDRPEPVAEITAAIEPTDTTITMTDTSLITAGDVLYIGAECFRVASVDSATQVTVVSAIIGSADGAPESDWLTWPVAVEGAAGFRSSSGAVGVIGAIGTRIARHDVPTANQQPPLPDTRVYLSNTRVKGRRVYLRRVSWGANANGVYGYREQLFGQFLITDARVNADATTVTVEATSLAASYAKAELGARGVADRGFAAAESPSTTYLRIDYDPAPDADARRIWKGSCAAYATDSEGTFVVGMDRSVDVGGAETVGIAVVTSRRLGLKPTALTEATGDRARALATGDESVGQTFKEVLLSDPLLIPRDTTGAEVEFPPVPAEHPYYSTDNPGGAGILTHPLLMVLAHLGQFDSNLPFHWQLRLDSSSVATDNITALAQQLPVPGWPGVCAVGPQKAMEWLAETFLRPLGCGWVVDEYGRLDVASVTSPRLSPWASPSVQSGSKSVSSVTVSAVTPGRQVLRIVESEAGVTQSVTGQGLGKNPRLTLQSADAYRVADGDPESATFVLNAMGAMSPDDSVDNLSALDLPAVAIVRTATSTIGTYLRSGSIQYVLSVPSGYVGEDEQFQPSPAIGPAMPSRYALPGSAVVVGDIPGLRKPPGNRLCIVMEHAWQDDCAAQRLRLLDAGSGVRIAAAGRVVSAVDNEDGTMSVVLEADFEVLPVPYVAPPFGSVTEDGETLAAFATLTGDLEYVFFTDPSLAIADTTPLQVVTYDTATNTLTLVAGSFPYVPSAGDFVLLSDLGTTDVDELFAYIGRDRYTL